MKGIRDVWNNIKQPNMPTEKKKGQKKYLIIMSIIIFSALCYNRGYSQGNEAK